jgi:DNA (cytosine-5)-methyltransferase 1
MAEGNKHALVAAFLAKHYGGHETPGSAIPRPFDTITARDHHALIASSLVKLKGTCRDGQPVTAPLHTVQASGRHYAEVRAFLMRFNGMSTGQTPAHPLGTIDTTDRFALVTVEGARYAIVDIGMRMLEPLELFRAQGVPAHYKIDPIVERTVRGKTVKAPLTKEAQVRMCGNMVSPPPAAALVAAQFPEITRA